MNLLPSIESQLAALDQHAIVSITDAHGAIVHVNDHFCHISGYSRAELLGQNHRIIRSDRHSPEFFADLWRTIAAGKTWQGEICNRHKSGSHYWVRSTITPATAADGETRFYIGIRTDITAQVESQEHLARVLHERDELFRIAPVGLAILDQRVIVRNNRAFETMLGYEPGELLGQSTRVLYLDNAQYQHLGTAAYAPLRRGEVFSQELSIRRKDGQTLWTLSAISALVPDQPFANSVFALADISRQKSLAAELQVALEAAETAQRARTAFLRSVTHEMLTPLHAISGFAHLLSHSDHPPEEREAVAHITQASEQMLAMVHSALEIATLDSEAQPEAPASVGLAEVLEAAVFAASRKGRSQHVTLELELTDDLRQVQVLATMAKLQRILGIVLDNGIHYNRPGGAVRITAAVADGRCTLRIADTGAGMTPEQLARLGTPFLRFSADSNRGGAGLGMALAGRLCAGLGLEMKVESVAGQGTTVQLVLPLAADVTTETVAAGA